MCESREANDVQSEYEQAHGVDLKLGPEPPEDETPPLDSEWPTYGPGWDA